MIVADRKKVPEIRDMIKDHERVLLVGCGTCVTVCLSGGEREAGILGSALRMSLKLIGRGNVVVDECTMESEEEMQRPLITPDEVMRLPKENALVFVAGQRPIWAMKGHYFEDPRLERRSQVPPPSRSEPIHHLWNTWTHVEPIEDDGAGVLGVPEDRDVDAEIAARSSMAEEEGHDDLLPEDLDDDGESAAAALA